MDPVPKPCPEGEVFRNFACGRYENCLDFAAERQWKGFSCQGCVLFMAIREDWFMILDSDKEGLGTLAATILGENWQKTRYKLLKG